MPPFRWEDIDHRLVVLKLVDLSEAMSNRIKADERRIRFENRLNLNSNAVPSLILQMKVESADEKARREYEIYCSVWQTQGYVKCAAFVRAVRAHIVQMLGVRAKSIANEFSRSARATNLPVGLRTAHLNKLDLRMRQLQGRWHRRLEIEAKECGHDEQRASRAQQAAQKDAEATGKIPTRKIRKPGRRPKLAEPFVIRAGTLWRKAIADSLTKVSDDQLLQLAASLDTDGYFPPSEYLEDKYARDLKAFNSRNSKSQIGPIRKWVQLVSLDDKDYLRGMRRLLSRCAHKLDGRSLSGN